MRKAIAATCAILALSVLPARALATDSPQDIYNAAQAAFDKEDWAGAAPGFAKFLPADTTKPLTPNGAVIAARLATALVHLGKYNEALVAAKRAIPSLPSNGLELFQTLIAAGDAARFSFDYPTAAPFYDRALAVAKAIGDSYAIETARIDLAYAKTTIDPVAVGAELDQALADKPSLAKLKKDDVALLEDLRARAAMNAGDIPTATRWADRAVDDSGGLGERVTLQQISIRGDAAIVAALRKDEESSHRLLTYTGAGHLTKMNWVGSFDGQLPVCADDIDLRPTDSVIVHFAIGPDGKVVGALPIYASRAGPLGAIFAEAVSSWRWNAQSLAGLDPFWRASLVLELRCASRPTPASLDKPVFKTLAAWFAAKGMFRPASGPGGVSTSNSLLSTESPQAIPALFVRINRHDDGVKATLDRLRAMLDANDAPAAAYAVMLDADARYYSHGGDTRQRARTEAARLAITAPTLRARFPNDPATAWLLLSLALHYEDGGELAAAQPFLQAVLDMPVRALPDDDPVRRVALLHKAMTASRLGQPMPTADLDASGLTAAQCSIFDTHPVATNQSVNSNDFPEDALRWGFEGYVREDFDIDANGHVTDPRTVVAYPPLVFGKSTEQTVRRFQFLPPKIGDKPVGCMGQTMPVNYRRAN